MAENASPTQVWDAELAAAVRLRHELHRHPELGWAEHRTAQRIRRELDRLGIAWRVCAETGTVATLNVGAAGEHVALRADIDALPIREESGLDFASEHEGCMHACGHDGHTAALVATAAWLARHEADLAGPVSLFFQPAEEGLHGAAAMIDDGALEGVDRVFGWHNWPALPAGTALCPDGTVMAANGTLRITVHGRGGHASQPERCRDPVLAAAAIILSLQQISSRRLPPQEAAVVSATCIRASEHSTIIPERVEIEGSVRAGTTQLRERIHREVVEIAAAVATGYGCRAEAEVAPRYPATVNSSAEARRWREALGAELGELWQAREARVPIMASEDFSYYLQERPGAFALIGCGSQDDDEPCHSPRYRFDDALIPLVARCYARLVGLPPPPRV